MPLRVKAGRVPGVPSLLCGLGGQVTVRAGSGAAVAGGGQRFFAASVGQGGIGLPPTYHLAMAVPDGLHPTYKEARPCSAKPSPRPGPAA